MKLPQFEISEGSRWWWVARLLLPRGYRFDRFTEEARRAVFFGRAAATDTGGTVLLPAHVLLGVMLRREGMNEGDVRKVLRDISFGSTET